MTVPDDLDDWPLRDLVTHVRRLESRIGDLEQQLARSEDLLLSYETALSEAAGRARTLADVANQTETEWYTNPRPRSVHLPAGPRVPPAYWRGNY